MPTRLPTSVDDDLCSGTSGRKATYVKEIVKKQASRRWALTLPSIAPPPKEYNTIYTRATSTSQHQLTVAGVVLTLYILEHGADIGAGDVAHSAEARLLLLQVGSWQESPAEGLNM